MSESISTDQDTDPQELKMLFSLVAKVSSQEKTLKAAELRSFEIVAVGGVLKTELVGSMMRSFSQGSASASTSTEKVFYAETEG